MDSIFDSKDELEVNFLNIFRIELDTCFKMVTGGYFDCRFQKQHF